MRFHFFTIEALQPAAGEEALNAFCAGQRVVSVDRHFVDQGASSYWSLCVATVDAADPARRTSGGRRERIDYKEILSESDFVVYAELRSLRKSLSEQEAVPAYAVFTNEQLAEMVTRRATSLAALGEIDGIGQARVEKYGKLFLALLQNAFATAPPPADDEAHPNHAG